ncbi:glycosyltransferase [Geomicrobium sp. JSM 1781026]|uniref:glycosyltransferase n=1 Tax=Geomicrobium sp. JSM 1781026 TaxID=3344580 RepID=UPI0035C0F6AE
MKNNTNSGEQHREQNISYLDQKHHTQKPLIIERWYVRASIILLFIVLLLLMFNVNVRSDTTFEYIITAFGTLGFTYLMSKLLLSFFYKPYTEEPNKEHKVSVVIPSYNEDPEAVKQSFESLLEQDYPIHEIIFIDDGSDDPTSFHEINEYAKNGYISHNGHVTKVITHRFQKNRGKRQAMAWGFQRAEGDVFLCADTDGYLYPDALRELLKPFNNARVTSVVGHINARNVKDSFITRLQDILYHNSFRIGRGAQSVTNSVLVCSGALSVHRREFVLEYLDEFLIEETMGIPLTNGDDRCLTYLSLKSGGKTKYQSTAMAITDVPIKTGKFFKQQVRWAKSFFIYTIKTLDIAWKKPAVLYWILGEGFLWIIFGVAKVATLLTWSGNFMSLMLLYTIAYFIIISLISGIYYVYRNPILYLLAPIFALAHTFIIIPVRVYALITIKQKTWGTR